MTLLNVLLVSYSFPPVGGVGVLRAASLARYLPSERIRLDVLTTSNASAVGTDSTHLKDISAEVKVHRTSTLDLPFCIKKGIKNLITGARPHAGCPVVIEGRDKPNFLKRAVQDILLPDPQVTWLPVLTRAASRIVRERNIDLVLITVPPFSSALLVAKLRSEFPWLPIVLDFRDEWLSTTIDLVSFSHSNHAVKIARNSEAGAVINASAVVAVTEGARREIQARYPHEPESKFHYIPNGFDATRLRCEVPSPGLRPEGKISVTYLGTIYNSSDPTTLVQALESLPPEVKSRFSLRFIGHIEEARFRAALLQLGEMVEMKGYMPQHEALDAMKGTDYVLLLTHDRLNISAKFYDYIGGGKPILGCVHPDGDVRRLLEELRAGWWADSRDVAGIRQLFVDAAARCDSLPTSFQPDFERIAQFERKVLAQSYATLLHSLASGRRDRSLQVSATELCGEVR
jgi:hypothetical protein